MKLKNKFLAVSLALVTTLGYSSYTGLLDKSEKIVHVAKAEDFKNLKLLF